MFRNSNRRLCQKILTTSSLRKCPIFCPSRPFSPPSAPLPRAQDGKCLSLCPATPPSPAPSQPSTPCRLGRPARSAAARADSCLWSPLRLAGTAPVGTFEGVQPPEDLEDFEHTTSVLQTTVQCDMSVVRGQFECAAKLEARGSGHSARLGWFGARETPNNSGGGHRVYLHDKYGFTCKP